MTLKLNSGAITVSRYGLQQSLVALVSRLPRWLARTLLLVACWKVPKPTRRDFWMARRLKEFGRMSTANFRNFLRPNSSSSNSQLLINDIYQGAVSTTTWQTLAEMSSSPDDLFMKTKHSAALCYLEYLPACPAPWRFALHQFLIAFLTRYGTTLL